MFPSKSNLQSSSQSKRLPVDSMQVDQNEAQNRGLFDAKSIIDSSKTRQDELQMLGTKIKQYEDSVKLLKIQKNKLNDSILDMQVMLCKFHPSSAPKIENEDLSHLQSEEETTQRILQRENSALGILNQLKTHHGTQVSQLILTKDVLGAVATLGKVDDENLNRLLSEYLGMQTMLAIVCKTYEGIKALETYDLDGCIDKTSGLHGLGASTGTSLDGRFLVICLESLRPYGGDFIAYDPQRRLDLLKPRLPNGECPPGFLGFAVNMIHVSATGNGLRETLFYNLFSHLQVYRTRSEMVLALPFISGGAVSLDGGIIRSPGVFSLGTREEVDVRFLKTSAMSDMSPNAMETAKKMNEMRREKEKLEEDMKRELALLNDAKSNFDRKKQEFLKFLAESSSYANSGKLNHTRNSLKSVSGRKR